MIYVLASSMFWEHCALIIKHKYPISLGGCILLLENQSLQIKDPNLASNRKFTFRLVILFLHKISDTLKI